MPVYVVEDMNEKIYTLVDVDNLVESPDLGLAQAALNTFQKNYNVRVENTYSLEFKLTEIKDNNRFIYKLDSGEKNKIIFVAKSSKYDKGSRLEFKIGERDYLKFEHPDYAIIVYLT